MEENRFVNIHKFNKNGWTYNISWDIMRKIREYVFGLRENVLPTAVNTENAESAVGNLRCAETFYSKNKKAIINKKQ